MIVYIYLNTNIASGFSQRLRVTISRCDPLVCTNTFPIRQRPCEKLGVCGKHFDNDMIIIISEHGVSTSMRCTSHPCISSSMCVACLLSCRPTFFVVTTSGVTEQEPAS